ncbi:MAG: BtpA/SgcQ family protein [Phycisphaerae bacterium]|nr:BtpA/SgcQ family protein [Phycisphaerae bacterium]
MTAFKHPRALVGMVHARALPGSPRAALPVARIVDIAVHEARALEAAGFDALIVENMHDAPYLRDASVPEVIAAMTLITAEVARAVHIPVGIQILSHAASAALAVAHAAGASFIRVEGFVFASVSDEGLVKDACAGQLLRDRTRLGAHGVRIFADLRKKHSSHAITADLSMTDWVEAAHFFGADGVIVTGTATGKPVDAAELAAARAASPLPVLVGSGATPEALQSLFTHAHAVIVGSSIKQGGLWSNELCPDRVRAIVAARDAIR